MRGTIVNEWDDIDGCQLEGCKGHLLMVQWPNMASGDVVYECSAALRFNTDGTVTPIEEQGDTGGYGGAQTRPTRASVTTQAPVTLQQAVETGYFIGCGERAISDPPIDVENLYTQEQAEENAMGDSLLAFLLKELVFDHEMEGPGAWTIARGRLERIQHEIACVKEALDTYQDALQV